VLLHGEIRWCRGTLDFSRPVALILTAVVHFLADEDEPARIIATLVDALPSGSYVVATHGTAEYPSRSPRTACPAFTSRAGLTHAFVTPRNSPTWSSAA
jgi:hypothetical protein